MTHDKIVLCGLVFFFVFFCVLGSEAKAQETAGIRLQPAVIEERVEPGQALTFTLRATNLAPEIKTFYLIKKNISRLSPTGSPIFAEEGEETGFEVSSWIKLPAESLAIAAGKTEEISFSIEVPKKASPGGHFGGIFLSLTPERPKETGVGVGYQVGTLVNLRVSGEVFEEARIREFRSDKTIYSRPDVKFITRVENLGNVLIRPRGPLEITDFFGKKVATLRVNNEGAGVFPKSTRQFENSWQGEGFVFGRYEVLMGLVYGEEEKKNVSATFSFWVLPLNIILPIFGGILGLILIIILAVKLHIRKKIREIYQTTNVLQQGQAGPLVGNSNVSSAKFMPFPKLILLTVVLLLFVLIFLAALFFFFA